MKFQNWVYIWILRNAYNDLSILDGCTTLFFVLRLWTVVFFFYFVVACNTQKYAGLPILCTYSLNLRVHRMLKETRGMRTPCHLRWLWNIAYGLEELSRYCIFYRKRINENPWALQNIQVTMNCDCWYKFNMSDNSFIELLFWYYLHLFFIP